jgi:hypothetical protein
VRAFDTWWLRAAKDGWPPALDCLGQPGGHGRGRADRGVVEVRQPPSDLGRLPLFSSIAAALSHPVAAPISFVASDMHVASLLALVRDQQPMSEPRGPTRYDTSLTAPSMDAVSNQLE